MKRRSWLWFIASVLLAVLAGVIAIYALQKAANKVEVQVPAPGYQVIKARVPIAANSIVRTDMVYAANVPAASPGAATSTDEVLGGTALKDIMQDSIILASDVKSAPGGPEVITDSIGLLLDNNKLAVALSAGDILSQWGAVVPGDHVDVLFTVDVVLESALPVESGGTQEAGTTTEPTKRDQSLDNVSVLALQNLEVLQVIEEPAPPNQQGSNQEQPATVAPKALILRIDPQDAIILKYMRDMALLDATKAKIDVALRSPSNNTLFNVDPVNINYLVLKYGITIPQPLK